MSKRVRLYIDRGLWFGFGLIIEPHGFSLVLPFVSVGMDW